LTSRSARWAAAVVAIVGTAGLIWKLNMPDTNPPVDRPITINDLVPVPTHVESVPGVSFEITETTGIRVPAARPDVASVGEYLADLLRTSTGYPLPVASDAGAISLRLDPAATPPFGEEGYGLEVTADGVVIEAGTAAGLFHGVQTVRQLLPATVESSSPQAGPWTVPGVRLRDEPRFAYRGFMLDVGRHFFGVADVKRLIDLAAIYKVNYLHLHLTDDQGWRIAIDSWPDLTKIGAGTEVGGGPGGFYTKAEYADIVDYAAKRYITVVPEIDLPGHTNAALASYPELNCNGTAPDRYTGIEVGFSSLCVDSDVTYRFLDDVFGELAAITPGPYLHIGGDEAKTLGPVDYARIVERAQEIVARHGKTVIGWHEVAGARLLDSTIAQFWGTSPDAPELVTAAKGGAKVIMSPANRAYLDIKYDEATRLGLHWPGYVEVDDAYDWDPTTYVPDLPPDAVIGVEGALWTETVTGMDAIEFLAFPRLAAIAEIGWSPADTHDWSAFRERLGAQGPRWTRLGIDFYRSPRVPWVAESTSGASRP
jgi:hexosaminidase